MSLDLDRIREKLDEIEESYNDDDIYHPGRYDSHLLQYVPNDIAALIAEVERLRADLAKSAEENTALRAEVETLRAEIAPWQTLSEKLGRQNDNMLSEIGRCCRALAATAEENTSLDRNLKDCVNFMRDLWPVVGVDLNALRLESDRAAAIETVRRAVEDWGTDD